MKLVKNKIYIIPFNTVSAPFSFLFFYPRGFFYIFAFQQRSNFSKLFPAVNTSFCKFEDIHPYEILIIFLRQNKYFANKLIPRITNKSVF